MPNPPVRPNPSAEPDPYKGLIPDSDLLTLGTSTAPQQIWRTPYFWSTLEVPKGLSTPQNARLTITVRYSVWFVDRNTLAGGAFFDGRGNAVMADNHGTPFKLLDWDGRAWPYFQRQFEKAGEFWNNRFRLLTPSEYSGLSFPTLMGDASIPWRPDVDCCFRLTTKVTPGEKSPTQLVVYAVRPEIFNSDPDYNEFLAYTKPYRSPAEMFLPMSGDSAHDLKVIAHELGHVINRSHDHIGSRLGTPGCGYNDNALPCYDAPGVPPNVMGNAPYGMGLLPVNAYGWQAAMENHTGVSRFKWEAVMKS